EGGNMVTTNVTHSSIRSVGPSILTFASESICRGRGVVLTAAAFVVYLVTLSRNFTGGSIEFATEIEAGKWQVLLQQHKLLSHPLGWAFLQLWNVFGWHGNALFPLQVLNALAGAVA